MRKLIVIALAAGCLAGCGLVDALFNGMKHSQAVEAALEQATGSKPQVGFNWHNGRLTWVTVTFPALNNSKSLSELADMTRAAVTKEFQQTPESIVLGFEVGTRSGSPAQSKSTL
jgi:hypothetical protein